MEAEAGERRMCARVCAGGWAWRRSWKKRGEKNRRLRLCLPHQMKVGLHFDTSFDPIALVLEVYGISDVFAAPSTVVEARGSLCPPITGRF